MKHLLKLLQTLKSVLNSMTGVQVQHYCCTGENNFTFWLSSEIYKPSLFFSYEGIKDSMNFTYTELFLHIEGRSDLLVLNKGSRQRLNTPVDYIWLRVTLDFDSFIIKFNYVL